MGEWRYTEEEQALEIKSLRRIIAAYLNYPEASEKDVRRYERSFKKIPASHKTLLSHLPAKYQRMRQCIAVNTSFIMNMLQAFEPPFDMSVDTSIDDHVNLDRDDEHFHAVDTSSIILRDNCGSDFVDSQHLRRCHTKTVCSHGWMNSSFQMTVPLVDIDKVRCIIRNIVRDWAEEGQKERDECYKPILEELNRLFPTRSNQSRASCLVPGAGLGRLALDISCLGFTCQGNEFSYYMMICSNFILNHTQKVNEWTIYPWIHSNSNSISDDDQLRPTAFPDVHPSFAGITDGFSMCGGDFVEVYSDDSQEGSWDAVVTCFFIDTAHNIVEYIEIISRILRDGGVWINLGPLLYHFAESYGQEDELSIEISLEDVKEIARKYDFDIEVEKTIETTYTANTRSMMQNRYFAAFWTMRRRPRQRETVPTDLGN